MPSTEYNARNAMIAPPELTKDERRAIETRTAVVMDRMGPLGDSHADVLIRETEKRVIAKARGADVECQACGGVGYHYSNGERL